MSIMLSSADLARLERAVRILVSPLDFETTDRWRGAVNREFTALLNADSAGFAVPESGGAFFYTEEHDPDAIARYPDFPPPDHPDGTPIWLKMFRARAGWLPALYGDRGRAYYASPYYNEYAGANRASDTLFAMMPVPAGEGMAGLHLWHERPDGRCFGEREVALIRLAYPAMLAGVHAQIALGVNRGTLLQSFDALEQCVMICDHAGAPRHRTTALRALLEEDPEQAQLVAAMERLALDLAPVRRRHTADVRLLHPDGGAVRQLRTATARYALRGCLHGQTSTGAPLAILVTVERLCRPELSVEQIHTRFGLTAAEARVAKLLGAGKPTAEIAEALALSPHTVRRHTERVFQKLGVKRRAAVAGVLAG